MSTDTYAQTMQAARATDDRAREGLLRRVLQLDALVSGANGAVYLAAAGPLADPLGLSSTLLRGAGVALLLFAAAVWLLASRPTVPAGPVGAVVAVNAVWALDSLAAPALGWLSPTTLGTVWIVMQAVVVAAFAVLQAYARRR